MKTLRVKIPASRMDGKMEFGKTNEIVQENQLHYPRSVTEQWNLQQFMANVEGRGGQKPEYTTPVSRERAHGGPCL